MLHATSRAAEDRPDSPPTPALRHGARELPGVSVEDYNAELKDGGGFVGDRARRDAFLERLEDWRRRAADPWPGQSLAELGKERLQQALEEGSPIEMGILLAAIEDFSAELAEVITRFLGLPAWKGTEALVIGGGFSAGLMGRLAIGRAAVRLLAAGQNVSLHPIHHDPDEAGLLGWRHMLPAEVLEGRDAFLAVDIGGTNLRAGVVRLAGCAPRDPARDQVWASRLWKHAEDKPDRDDAVCGLATMLHDLSHAAIHAGLRLAPVVGISCPGLIDEEGHIERGGQNLPGGDWEEDRGFSLPAALAKLVPRIGGGEASFLMHNDAVAQGMSEAPAMQGVSRWGVLTIGTGLGNASFRNHSGETGRGPAGSDAE
ncbi:hypothetical protein MVG78_08295 [Roseomonas gilardii subsp. gilardii]|uniref:hypothetical protein n=1 Tax=Roseomonas gilardii TaxID=257708 RepID=UPI001FF8E904|nr:hypothetical protein [Roseomonas gilardii]UPG74108.1 hypothetical protein MVG78_08295 [Roseomonas gilardii subsp. gilardii]